MDINPVNNTSFTDQINAKETLTKTKQLFLIFKDIRIDFTEVDRRALSRADRHRFDLIRRKAHLHLDRLVHLLKDPLDRHDDERVFKEVLQQAEHFLALINSPKTSPKLRDALDTASCVTSLRQIVEMLRKEPPLSKE